MFKNEKARSVIITKTNPIGSNALGPCLSKTLPVNGDIIPFVIAPGAKDVTSPTMPIRYHRCSRGACSKTIEISILMGCMVYAKHDLLNLL